MKAWMSAFAGAVLLSFSGASFAVLIDRGGGLIYDDDLDITWVADAGQSGAMTWAAALTWVDDFGYAGYDDWRLPTVRTHGDADPCFFYDCTDSELGHLFYEELGGVAGTSLMGDVGPFTDIQDFYWTDTESPTTPVGAVGFRFRFGFQDYYFQTATFNVWAVRDGDVASVSEPATLALIGIGLLGVLWRRRRSP